MKTIIAVGHLGRDALTIEVDTAEEIRRIMGWPE